jgi:hypothetical protein
MQVATISWPSAHLRRVLEGRFVLEEQDATQIDGPHLREDRKGIPLVINVTYAPNRASTKLIPQELKNLPRWNPWKYHYDKTQKVPYRTNGYPAKATDEYLDQWTTVKAAYQSYRETAADGIGFLFVKSDPYTGIDLDNVLNPETGEVSERGMAIISKFSGAYKEISPSGTGVKLIVRGKKPEWCSGCKKKFENGEQIEIYDHSHYFTITGYVFGEPVREIAEHGSEIEGLCDDLFPEEPDDYTPSPVDVEELGLGDRDLLNILISFHGEKFKRLFDGDISLYRDDHSAADIALCTYLAFVTRSRETIDRIFRASGLYREKWERETYREPTITNALKRQTEFYDPTGEFLKYRVEKMYLKMLQVRWEDYRDGLIVLALLEMAHEGCRYRGDAIIVDASLRDLRLRTNISLGTISKRITFLHHSPYPLQFLRRGEGGQRSRFLVSPPDKNSIPSPDSNDNSIDTSSSSDNQHVSNIMFRVRTLLAYSPLNVASQWAILRVIPHRKIAQNEVYAIMDYKGSEKNFRRYVVNPLKKAKLIRVDKRGFINLRDDIQDKAQKVLDEDRYERTIAEVKREREDYKQRVLHTPLTDLLRSRRSGSLADVADRHAED